MKKYFAPLTSVCACEMSVICTSGSSMNELHNQQGFGGGGFGGGFVPKKV